MSAAPGTDALEPVRAELLRVARADAEALLAAARRDAAEAVAVARAKAETIVESARSEGTAEGEKAKSEELARARRQAGAAELAVRGEAYAQLRRRVTERLRERYETDPAIGEGLRARARRLLGPDAQLTEHPEGGVVASVPGRRVDLGLPALAARALDRVSVEAETLWAP
ncbi:hypothetical protein [Kitasatospora sp. NPDC001175]|uniref:hypothetical protein n=1 Tax=Kitasatospora sp. NPDC001175 TaxID=3157103 RepID=UPI003CFE6890